MDAPVIVDPRRRGVVAGEGANEHFSTLLVVFILYLSIVLSRSSTDPTVGSLLQPLVSRLASMLVDLILPYILRFGRFIYRQVQRILAILNPNNRAAPLELPFTNATHHHHIPQLEDTARSGPLIPYTDQHAPETSPGDPNLNIEETI